MKPTRAPELTDAQLLRQTIRLYLEEEIFTAQMYLGDVKRECTEHVVIKGNILWSPRHQKVVQTPVSDETCCGASCAVCGADLGWWCPKNPKGYCEYDESDTYGCKWCHEPDERK